MFMDSGSLQPTELFQIYFKWLFLSNSFCTRRWQWLLHFSLNSQMHMYLNSQIHMYVGVATLLLPELTDAYVGGCCHSTPPWTQRCTWRWVWPQHSSLKSQIHLWVGVATVLLPDLTDAHTLTLMCTRCAAAIRIIALGRQLCVYIIECDLSFI